MGSIRAKKVEPVVQEKAYWFLVRTLVGRTKRRWGFLPASCVLSSSRTPRMVLPTSHLLSTTER